MPHKSHVCYMGRSVFYMDTTRIPDDMAVNVDASTGTVTLWESYGDVLAMTVVPDLEALWLLT